MNTIGLVKVETGVGSGGVGFLVVPDEIDRVQYIEDCNPHHRFDERW